MRVHTRVHTHRSEPPIGTSPGSGSSLSPSTLTKAPGPDFYPLWSCLFRWLRADVTVEGIQTLDLSSLLHKPGCQTESFIAQSREALGLLLTVTEPQLSHLENGHNNTLSLVPGTQSADNALVTIYYC